MPMHWRHRKHRKEILFLLALAIAVAVVALGAAHSVSWAALIAFAAIGLLCLWLIGRLQ
ncbi:MAG: hypothetical protein J6P53_02545 [Mailhella sp.]|nr:hypothetical protein [Mailhella sp.]